MLAAFSLLGITTTLALFFDAQGQWFVAAALFTLGTLGSRRRGVLRCAAARWRSPPTMTACPRRATRWDTWAAACFAINVVIVSKPAWFGLAGAADAVRWSFVTVAVWWFVFMLPLLWFVEEPFRRRRAWRESLAAGWKELASTAQGLAATLLKFLVAYWLASTA
jgi:UMF1 family MFS transporter